MSFKNKISIFWLTEKITVVYFEVTFKGVDMATLYQSVDTTLEINNKEYQVTFDFEYTPEEKQYFDPVNGIGSPGYEAEVVIISVRIVPNEVPIDLMSTEYEWILSESNIEELKDVALEHLLTIY